MNVLIGDVFDPATFYVAPLIVEERDVIKEMEWDLSSLCQSGRLGDKGPAGLAEGQRVAVKSSRRAALWQRGRIVCVDQVAGAGFRRNDRVTVDVFLVDVGKTIKNVDLNSRIRNLPKRYDEIEDAAFVVRLEGLKPISKTVDFTKRGRFRNTVSRTWNDLCLHMLVTLIKISDGQIFYDSDVDVGVCVKGGIPIRVGKIIFDLPLMIEAKQQDKLRPYTSYITSGMWLQGERRLLDLNQCLTANEFAVKMNADEMFSPTTEALQPILTLLDEKKGQNPYFSSRNTTSSSTYYDDDWYKYSWGCADEDGDHETEAKAEREAARKVTEDRIRQHLEDMEGYVPGEEGETDLEDDEVETSNVAHITQTTLSSGILVEEEDPNASFVVGSDGEKYYECREEFDD